ncbi:MAG: FAD-binding protein [Planctomycetia bacterium]
MKAIVIGSGIAGLAAALAFRRVGIEATVYERASELTEVGAGISLWANALRALDHGTPPSGWLCLSSAREVCRSTPPSTWVRYWSRLRTSNEALRWSARRSRFS